MPPKLIAGNMKLPRTTRLEEAHMNIRPVNYDLGSGQVLLSVRGKTFYERTQQLHIKVTYDDRRLMSSDNAVSTTLSIASVPRSLEGQLVDAPFQYPEGGFAVLVFRPDEHPSEALRLDVKLKIRASREPFGFEFVGGPDSLDQAERDVRGLAMRGWE